ncbi:molybdate ABC transporter substrate-binding protein [bacterium]|nr:molybdate ABC transporter substrate-binding protein [bacterium]
MKKVTLFFIVSGLLLLGLIACTQKQEEKKEIPVQPQENKVEKTEPKDDASKLTIFAAASMTETLDKVIEAYKKVNPNLEIIATYDSSGTLKTQIQEGATCDIFISAAQKQMNQLDASKDEKSGNKDKLDFVLQGSRVNLLENKVVLAVPADNKAQINSFADLGSDKLKLLCIGNEDVPVGAYSQEILKNLNIWEKLQEAKKLTYGSNVKEVTTQVKEGTVDAGIIYATDAAAAGLTVVDKADDKLCFQVIYPAAIMKNTQNLQEAQEFMKFLQSKEAMDIFATVGFTPAK